MTLIKKALRTRTRTWSVLRSATMAPGMSSTTANRAGAAFSHPKADDEAPNRARNTGRKAMMPPVANPNMPVFR